MRHPSSLQSISRTWLGGSLAWLLVAGLVRPLPAQSVTDSIRLNQVGYYPGAPKLAVVTGAAGEAFALKTPDRRTTVFTGTLGAPASGTARASSLRIADFSGCTTPGTYVLEVPGLGVSYPFQIRARVHEPAARAALKSYYYQRASVALPARYARAWNRPAGHPDSRVLVHSSAATAQRPAGTVISASRGWYDAGDYNKYVVNSGITLGTLLSLYEDFPAYSAQLKTDIPESANGLPDLLDESLWNVRWLLAMQDPQDGGVYHKLTNAGFDGMVMPTQATSPRYVVQKSTAATLDFAAVLAQASRIMRRFERQLPGLSDSCLQASMRAWHWAQQHPAVTYQQEKLNRQFTPAISTGAYGDEELQDELAWAAAELYLTTRQPQYYAVLQPTLAQPGPATVPSWSQVQTLGLYSLLRFRSQLPAAVQQDLVPVRTRLLDLAEALVKAGERQPYRTIMGGEVSDYNWGSNANAANQGLVLVAAYQLSRDKNYLRYALANLDYLLGRNATGYCFLTGFGTKTPQHPHQRLAEADGVAAPLPGFLVGGPNAGRQDSCQYPSRQPARAYVDDVCSYASNEVAINWNAPLVYLLVALEATQHALRTP
ncbi:glycoside hydrolase family 9 protein [Hymenobacter seoulensis]